MSELNQPLPSGSADLRFYISQAFLPQLQPIPILQDDHPIPLHVKPDQRRLLVRMGHFDYDNFAEHAKAWLDDCVSNQDSGELDWDRTTGDHLSIANASHFSIPPRFLKYPNNLEELVQWVDQLPLQTLQCVLHRTLKHTQDYTFQLADPDHDECWLRYLRWSIPSTRSASLVVIIQPPWLLQDRDLLAFAKLKELAPVVSASNLDRPYYHGVSRVWAKVSDVCRRENCHYFVLTTYNHWILGIISEDWTHGTTVRLAAEDCPGNLSIMECLVYWAISAMGLPGGWDVALNVQTSRKSREELPAPLTKPLPPPPPSLSTLSSRSVEDLIVLDPDTHPARDPVSPLRALFDMTVKLVSVVLPTEET